MSTTMECTHASLRSSTSSLYRNYDFHFDIVKLTGVVVLLSLMTATLAMVTHVHTCEYNTDCIELTTSEAPTMNDSLCTYAQQFPLPKNYVVTVCTYQGEVRIDVRKFIGGRPTILGYFMNTEQWNHLKRLTPRIDNAIVNATREPTNQRL